MTRRPPDQGHVNNRTDIDFEIRIPNAIRPEPVDDDERDFITPKRAKVIRCEIDAMIAAGDWPPSKPKPAAAAPEPLSASLAEIDEIPVLAGCERCARHPNETCYLPARLCARTSVGAA